MLLYRFTFSCLEMITAKGEKFMNNLFFHYNEGKFLVEWTVLLFGISLSSHFNSHAYTSVSSFTFGLVTNSVTLQTRRNHSKWVFSFIVSSHRLLCFKSWCGWFWLRKINVCLAFIANKNKSCRRKQRSRKQRWS